MENAAKALEELFDQAEVYGKVSLELARLKALQASTRVLSGLAARLSIFVVLLLFVLVVSVGSALWLGDLMGKLHYGFFAVAGFYLLVWIILRFFLSKQLRNFIARVIVRQIFQ